MKTIEIETAAGNTLSHVVRGEDIEDDINYLNLVRDDVIEDGRTETAKDYTLGIDTLYKLRTAEAIMVAQAGRIAELEAELKAERDSSPLIPQAERMAELEADLPPRPGLEAGDCFEVYSNQADREANVLAVLFDEPSARWQALIELCMPNGSTSLGILIAEVDGRFTERDSDRFGSHHFVDKNVSYAKLPKKWLRAIGEQSTESTEVTDSYPHTEVLCGHSQNGSIYIYRDGELDEVDPDDYFGGKLDAYPQSDKWGSWERRRCVRRERAENFFNI
jgi:hypothetical protein